MKRANRLTHALLLTAGVFATPLTVANAQAQAPAPAQAATESPPPCHLWIVHALPDAGGVDPRLGRLKRRLEKPPFAEWKKFDLLEEKTLQLQPNAPSKFTLPNGRQGTLTLLQVIDKGSKRRLELQLTVTEEGNKRSLDTKFEVDEGRIFMTAGQKHLNGTLILGVGCDKDK